MSSKLSSVKDMYQQVASDSLPVEAVFSAISDNKSLSLFNIIGFMSSHASDVQPTGEILISRMNLTRRQYYTRINQLRDASLITRKSTKFVFTSLGRVVYETHKTIGVAIQNRWRLQAIDSLENTLIPHGMPTEERISEKYFCPLSCRINEYVLSVVSAFDWNYDLKYPDLVGGYTPKPVGLAPRFGSNGRLLLMHIH